MRKHTLEEVFNEATFPEVTFVPPKEFPHILSSFRAVGKHVTVSGPSGTGKTTLVSRVIRELGIQGAELLEINGRRYKDVDSILLILGQAVGTAPTFDDVTPYLQSVRFVIIDDFHHMKPSARSELAKTLKLWHEKNVRFVIIGIASSASELFGEDSELGIRNDPFEIRTQDEAFVRKLISLGESALNIKFSDVLSGEIVDASNGVPSIVQVICRTCCIEAGIVESTSGEPKPVDFQLKALRESVLRVFRAKYMDKLVGLAKGKQQARSVHNTYFDIVATVAGERGSEIPVELLYRKIVGTISDAKQRNRKATSFYNCLANLSEVIADKGLDDTILYRKGGKYISIEDPSFRFYLNLVDLEEIKARIHLRNDQYPYDVAVSFAGDVRPTVEEFVRALKKRGLEVFYDFDKQAHLWGQDLRSLLANVYANEARYMVVFLSRAYPERDWTDFELAIGKGAAEKRTEEYLLPLVLDDVEVVGIKSTIGYVDLRKVGIDAAADLLADKIER